MSITPPVTNITTKMGTSTDAHMQQAAWHVYTQRNKCAELLP